VSDAFCCFLSTVVFGIFLSADICAYVGVFGICSSANMCTYVGREFKYGVWGGYVGGTRGREKERAREDERASETERVYVCVRERA